MFCRADGWMKNSNCTIWCDCHLDERNKEMSFPDAVVEAAAKEVYRQWQEKNRAPDWRIPWSHLETKEQRSFLDAAREVLAAGAAESR